MASSSTSTSRRLTTEQREFIVRKYKESGKKMKEVTKAWEAEYGTKPPAYGSMAKLIKKYEETGSVETKNPRHGWGWILPPMPPNFLVGQIAGRQPKFQPRLPAPGSKLYQIKIVLEDSSPEIWRRVLVPEDFNFEEFAWTVILAVGWYGNALWYFTLPDGDLYKEDPVGMDKDQRKPKDVKLSDVFGKTEKVDYIRFEYAMGDAWQHIIILEKKLDPEPKKKYPVCIAGKNACPPENSGGIDGYNEMIKAAFNPKHKEHKHYKGWLKQYSPGFDPKRFSPSSIVFEKY